MASTKSKTKRKQHARKMKLNRTGRVSPKRNAKLRAARARMVIHQFPQKRAPKATVTYVEGETAIGKPVLREHQSEFLDKPCELTATTVFVPSTPIEVEAVTDTGIDMSLRWHVQDVDTKEVYATAASRDAARALNREHKDAGKNCKLVDSTK